MSATDTVIDYLNDMVPRLNEGRELFARRLFYMQMEIYSTEAMTTLFSPGDFELLDDSLKQEWLTIADKITEASK